jgi:hypothetical protein
VSSCTHILFKKRGKEALSRVIHRCGSENSSLRKERFRKIPIDVGYEKCGSQGL